MEKIKKIELIQDVAKIHYIDGRISEVPKSELNIILTDSEFKELLRDKLEDK